MLFCIINIVFCHFLESNFLLMKCLYIFVSQVKRASVVNNNNGDKMASRRVALFSVCVLCWAAGEAAGRGPVPGVCQAVLGVCRPSWRAGPCRSPPRPRREGHITFCGAGGHCSRPMYFKAPSGGEVTGRAAHGPACGQRGGLDNSAQGTCAGA